MKSGLLALLMIVGFAVSAAAQDVAVVVGVRSDSADPETSTNSISASTGFQAGGVAKFEMSGPWWIRSGFIVEQRVYEYNQKTTSPNDSSDMRFTYFDIPVDLMYKFSQFGGVFLGPAVALNISKDCGDFTCSGVNGAPLSLQLGASFKFAPNFGFELYYEDGLSKIEDEIKNPKAIIANLMITFD